MKEADRSKEELITELHALRLRLAELEADTAPQEVPPLDAAERQRAEEALRESEAKNRTLVRAIPDTMFRMNREGVYLDFIPAEGFETLLPPEAFLGKPVHEIMPAEIAETAMHFIKEALRTNEPQRFEYDLMLNEEWHHYEERLVPDEVDSILAIVRDITERRVVEEALRESDARLRTTIAHAPVVLFTLDQHGIFTLSEGKGLAQLGLEPGQVVGLSVFDLYADNPDILENIRRVLAGQEQAWIAEVEDLVFDTRAIPLRDEHGQVTGLIGVATDITEQKQVEQALRESEEKFAKAFRASPDAITISRLRDGCYLEVNDGFERLTGYQSEEVLGKTSTELQFWRAEDRKRMAEPLRRTGRVSNLKTGFLVKSGVVRDCVISAEVIELGGEKCLVAITRDVTEQKRAEAERERLIEELEAQNAELERFTYTISHDLKSPLVTIKGFLGLLEKDALEGKTELMKQDIEQISRAADKMQRLLGDLLELSRIGRLVNPPEAVSLTDLAREAVEQVAGQIAERGIAVEIASEMPVVVGDRVRLLEVLQILIDNAVKYMGNQPAPRIEVEATQQDPDVSITVRDNGIGIEPRFQDKVFGLFERLDAASEGTGIGLALARRIVEVHGGRIWVESQGRGHGARFVFTLPQ